MTGAGGAPTLWSLGHSNRSAGDLVALVRGAGLELVADVRRFPRSRRHPWFDGVELAATLARAGVGYLHLADLGGHRDPVPGSPNTGLDEPWRAYADHMATPAFARALARLVALAAERRTGILCAEASWERCHRRLLADRLAAGGARVLHLAPDGSVAEHLPSAAARLEGDRLVYRGVEQLGLPWFER